MKVYLSPSMQFYNKYAYGNTTEADQCYRIAKACCDALLRSNVKQSNNFKVDYHICIHTNAIGGDNSVPKAEGCVTYTAKANVNSAY